MPLQLQSCLTDAGSSRGAAKVLAKLAEVEQQTPESKIREEEDLKSQEGPQGSR